MIDQQEFIARLQRIMNYYDLNASALADSLGVLRSSISHLLSERNKPSLDFVLRIVDKYPEVDLYWLLYGKGNFPKEEHKEKITSPEILFPPHSTPFLSEESSSLEKVMNIATTKEIQKIIFFYNDNSFEIFQNSQK